MRRVAPEELRDDFGIQGGTSYGDSLQRLDEVADVGHPVLQEVADAGGIVGQQVGGVAGLDVLGEEEDAHPLVAVAQFEGEAEALVGERSAACGCRSPRRRAGSGPPSCAARPDPRRHR